MNTSSIRRLVQMVMQSRIAELQVESEPMVRVVVRNGGSAAVRPGIEPCAAVSATVSPQVMPSTPTRRIVASPLVGTFRHAMTKNDVPLVRCGERIEAGQVLCVIEAMHLKHEIRSSREGRLAEVLVDEGDAVDFGRPLFSIDYM